ncbi:MAG: PAS domain S-box protein, partial [Bacteroidota bacterium]
SSEKQLKQWEIKYKSKSNKQIWCIENAYLEELGDGKVITGTIQDISKQKATQEKFQMLFESSNDAILIVEGDDVVEINHRALEIFQINQEELSGFRLLDSKTGLFVFSDSDWNIFQLKLQRVLDGNAQRAKLLGRRTDGTHFHAEVYLSPFLVAGNLLVQLQVRDISERVLYESSIRESEERFKMLSQLAMEGIAIVHKDRILDCNDQLVRLFGYRKEEELLSKEVSNFLGKEDLRRLRNTFGLSVLNKTEIRAKSRHGKLLFLEALGSKINYNNQDCEVYLFYDITSRKRTEQALEQSIERYKNLVENSPNGIFILTDGKIKYINHSGLNLLELEEEDDVFDQNFALYFEDRDQYRILDILHLTREGEETDYEEFKMMNSNNSMVDVGLKATLTVYDNKPSIQVTVNNLSTQTLLVKEQMRAKIAEEINLVLKREIEEHKNTQKKLLNARNFTRNIIESSIDMIIAVDEKGRITEFNKAAQQQFGFELDEVLGGHVKSLYSHFDEFKTVSRSINEDLFFTGEISNVKKNGDQFTTLLSASVIRNEQGDPVGSMGVSRDVTELKKAEEELRASEERYRDLFENATDFIINVDDLGQINYANNAFCSAMGIDVNNVHDVNFKELAKEGQQIFSHGVLNALPEGTHALTLIDVNGKELLVEGVTSMKLKEGKPHSVRAIFRNMTEVRQNEKLAREQTAKIISIFNSTENLMMWTMDKEAKVTSFNSNFNNQMQRDFGFKINFGTSYLKEIEHFFEKQNMELLNKALNKTYNGKPSQIELPFINQENEEVWFQFFLNPVHIENELQEISCLAYDITDRKEIDQKIRNSLKEKEVLLQEVHHRVKNNLQVISSILNLQTSFVEDEHTLEILAESQNRIKTMSYIHETLYQTADFSSIEFTDYIETLARNLIQSYAPKDCDVELVSEFDQIFLDLDQAIPCGLIMNELVSNALKYAFQGRDVGSLAIRVKQHEQQISLEVTDDGIGMPKGYKPEESDSLGIYLVYALVEQLDAEITMKSNKDEESNEHPSGTSFLITFTKP